VAIQGLVCLPKVWYNWDEKSWEGSAMSKKARIRNYLTLREDRTLADMSIQVAESDRHLTEYYVGRERYVARAISPQDPASVFIGPKGIGKSAILQMIRLEFSDNRKNYLNHS
jgi:hypothetical protein